MGIRSSRHGEAGEIALGELARDRAFVLYLAGQTTSATGAALSGIALVFAVLSISGSPSSVGIVLLAGRLPAVALALAGGIIADRWSRQRTAVVADVTRTAVQAITGVLLLNGQATVPLLAALQLLGGGAAAIFGPAASALAAQVAPRGQIRRASSVLGITTAIAQTGGLALSGMIVALAGPGASFLIDSATFAVSALTLALIPPTSGIRSGRGAVLRDLRAGWRVVTARGWLVTYAVHETAVNVLVLGPFFVLGPVIAQQRLGGAPAWSAIAFGYVLGNLAAAHITFHWSPHRPVRAALSISVGLTPMLALLGLGASIWLIVPAAVLAGAQSTIYNTLLTSTVQSNLPSDTLGRALAIIGIGSTTLVPVGMGVAGSLAAAAGTSTVLVGGAGLVLATTAVCLSLPASHAVLRLDLHR